MPFESKAQMRWMFAKKPEMAKEWAAHTPDTKDLPEKKKKVKKSIEILSLDEAYKLIKGNYYGEE